MQDVPLEQQSVRRLRSADRPANLRCGAGPVVEALQPQAGAGEEDLVELALRLRDR